MDSSRMLVALGFAVYLLGQVAPAFVPASASARAPPKLGGLPGAEAPGRQSPESGSAGATLLAVGVGAVVGVTANLRRASGRSSATKRRADDSGGMPSGPIVVYAKALQDAAAAKGESVPVTKDVLKLKAKLEEDYNTSDFLEGLHNRNMPGISEVEEAELMIKLLQPLESTVLPKFLIFLAKKTRLVSLERILFEYVQTLYINQSVAPVRVISASPLSEAQKTAIKEKMAKRIGVDDIKLVCEYDLKILSGFRLEYGFTDPDVLNVPTMSEDYTMSTYIDKVAMDA